jgi:uncharacterized membrane protein YidH (DUF202 family)
MDALRNKIHKLRSEMALLSDTEEAEEAIGRLDADEAAFAEEYIKAPSKSMVRQEAMIINEVSLILAEKRTALSVLRTGLAILVLPMSVLSVLIAISRLYEPSKVIYLLAPLLGICFILGVFGIYLIVRAWRRSISLDLISMSLKRQNAHLNMLLSLMDGKAGKRAPCPLADSCGCPPGGPEDQLALGKADAEAKAALEEEDGDALEKADAEAKAALEEGEEALEKAEGALEKARGVKQGA